MCVCVCALARPRMYRISTVHLHRPRNKQLTQASFNLIDSVLKNNTAYFGCSASKLTAVTSLCLTLGSRRSAAVEGGSVMERHENGRNGRNGDDPLEWDGGASQKPSPRYLFRLLWFGKAAQRSASSQVDVVRCDWQVSSFFETLACTICTIYWTNVGFDPSSNWKNMLAIWNISAKPSSKMCILIIRGENLNYALFYIYKD